MNREIVYWKQRDGKSISIDDMDINHLRNVLKMIIRNSQKVQSTHNSKQSLGMSNIDRRFKEDEINDIEYDDVGCDATEIDLY